MRGSLKAGLRRMIALLAAGCAGAAAAQVGMTQIDAGGLPVTLVYPTLQPAQAQAFGPFMLTVAPDAPLAPAPAAGPADAASARSAAAAVDDRGARRMLIVLSHGTGGGTHSDHQLAATLARAGFVVAQPLHFGDNHRDRSLAGPSSWQRRPQEVSRTLDALAADPVWGPRLALQRVGVHGMSAGGVTALVLAGASWRLLDLVRHCERYADDDAGFCFNGQPTPQAQAARRASFERARGVPEVFLPAQLTTVYGASAGAGLPDLRVAAATVAVPVAALFTADRLREVAIAVGVVSAGGDRLLLPRHHSEHLLHACPRCERIAHLAGAGHMDLLGPWPPEVAQRVGAGEARGGWPEPDFDPAERQAAFDAIAAFFQRKLRP
jgi:predicted dienelactone hydrolase